MSDPINTNTTQLVIDDTIESPFQAIKKQQQQQQQLKPPLPSTSSNIINTPPIQSNTSKNKQTNTQSTATNQPIISTNTNNINSIHASNSKLSLLLQGPPQLTPPALFGIIEPQLYRSNSLYPLNFPFIKLLGLKTVVQLSPEVPIKAVTSFLEENNINLIHLGLKAWKADASWKPVTEELIKETLEIVLNYDYYPLMITCTSGIHQTGVLVGCLRRLQSWNLTSILVEYRSFTGQSNTRYVNEQFIELFDVDLVTLPSNRLPNWFIEQQKMLEEEEEEEEEERIRNIDN